MWDIYSLINKQILHTKLDYEGNLVTLKNCPLVTRPRLLYQNHKHKKLVIHIQLHNVMYFPKVKQTEKNIVN